MLLSEKEKTVLAILVDKKFIKDGEKEFKAKGIPLSTAYKIVESCAKKGSEARMVTNQILGFRRKSKKHFGLLNQKLRYYEIVSS